jgi:hypothetical protein
VTILLTIDEHSIVTPFIQILRGVQHLVQEFVFPDALLLSEIYRAGFVGGLFLARSVFKYDIIDLVLFMNTGLECDTTDELYSLQDLEYS